jgi:hypothetical protein
MIVTANEAYAAKAKDWGWRHYYGIIDRRPAEAAPGSIGTGGVQPLT